MDPLEVSEQLKKAGVPAQQAKEHARVMNNGYQEWKKESRLLREEIHSLEVKMLRYITLPLIIGLFGMMSGFAAIYFQIMQLTLALTKN